jgi:hypothetical protein
MPPGIGAGGFAGLALETVPGTYAPPTKYFPFTSESLAWQQDINQRRPIRQTADVVGAVLGNAHVEGDLTMEALEDVVPYFLYCARATVTKTGTTNLTYVFKPNANSIPSRTMSITVVRNGQVFGYVGLVVSSFTFNVDNGELMFTASMVGRDEATQTTPTPTFVNTAPFSLGQFTTKINGATITDADTFSFQVEDNGAAQNRIMATRGAAFVSYGERNVTVSMDRDFNDRSEYDAWKVLTQYAVHLDAVKGVNNSIAIDVPVAYKSEYSVNLGGQGDLLRVTNSWVGIIDATGNSYTVTILCQESIT